MKRIIAVALARTKSSRLPNKVLFDLGGKPAFIQVVERMTATIEPDEVFVACTKDARDDPIELLANLYNVKCFRGPQEIIFRLQMLCCELGLTNDDWLVTSLSDSVLAEHGWIGAALSACDQYDCDYMRVVVPDGTLIRAFAPFAFGIRSGGYFRTMLAEIKNVIALEGCMHSPGEFRMGYKRCLIFNFPNEYLVPWPWAYMFLDYDVQGLVLKEIYDRLYRGEPIDIFDVYKLLQKDRVLSQILSIDLPETIDSTPGAVSREIENIRQEADHVEVLWTGGENVELIRDSMNVPESRNTGERTCSDE